MFRSNRNETGAHAGVFITYGLDHVFVRQHLPGFNVVLELGKQREEVFFHLARFIKRHRHAVLGDHPLNGFRRRLGQILIVFVT